jgi:small ligand-binding sensory domain FIST
MIRAGVGLSTQSDAANAAREAAANAMNRASIRSSDLALVFATVHYANEYPVLLQTIQKTTRARNLVGCSGIGVLTTDVEVEGSPSVAVLVVESDHMKVTPIHARLLKGRSIEVGREIGNQVAASKLGNDLLVLMPDAYNVIPPALLQGIGEEVKVPIVGAGPSEDGSRGVTYQLMGSRAENNSVVGFLLSGSIKVSLGISQGCQPISPASIVTRAEGNMIHEIGGRPAFEVFSRLLKGPLAEDLRRAVSSVFIGLPVDHTQTALEPGEYRVRSIVGIDRQHGILAVSDEVAEGDLVVFTLRDAVNAREDLDRMLSRQAEALPESPAFGLYFNCAARGQSFYGIPNIDTAYIKRHLGEISLAGFFGSFELAPMRGINHLHTYTGVLALISEDL